MGGRLVVSLLWVQVVAVAWAGASSLSLEETEDAIWLVEGADRLMLFTMSTMPKRPFTHKAPRLEPPSGSALTPVSRS